MIRTKRVAVLLVLAGAGCGDLTGTEGDDVALAEAALQLAPNLQPSGVVVQTTTTTTEPSALVATSPASRYYLIDLGPAETGTIPRLNRNGAAIWNANGHAFVYQNCQSRDLGSLAGGATFARGINNAGVIVGKSKVGADFHAFSYSSGTMRDLGGNRGFAFWQEAIASTYLGDVVGNEGVSTVVQSGVRFQDGVTVPLATFNGLAPTRVVDMNDSAFVVATQESSSGVKTLLSTNGGHLWRQVQGLPGLETMTTPFAENAYGHVVGAAGNGFSVRAFVSRDPDQPATDLGTLGGSLAMAEGINSQGWVVGWAEQTNGGGPRAFLHDRTTMIDLNTRLTGAPGWLLLEGSSINDAGQIVGWAKNGGQDRIVFLEPARTLMVIPRCSVGSPVISADRVSVKSF